MKPIVSKQSAYGPEVGSPHAARVREAARVLAPANDSREIVSSNGMLSGPLDLKPPRHRVILGHPQRLTDLANAVEQAKIKLLYLGTNVTDIREAAVFVQGVCHLASATRTLIAQERKAFNLDEQQPAETAPSPDYTNSFARLRARFDEVLAKTPRPMSLA